MVKEKDSLKKFSRFSYRKKALRDKEAIKKAKKQAIKDEKDKRRRKIVKGEIQLEEDPVQKKEVVQNIKLFEWSAPEIIR